MGTSAFLRSEDIRPSAPAGLAGLALGALGIVYGDIGTSPLYAMREALHPVVAAGGDLRAAVLGVASLLIWALILIPGLIALYGGWRARQSAAS